MIIYKIICGSKLYGTNTPDSDTDYGEVLVEPETNMFGINLGDDSLPQKITEESDLNRHWLKRFAYLCYKGNPNVLEWLFAPADKVISCSQLFKKHILDNKSMFVALDTIKRSHFGFANAQISKMCVYSSDRGESRKAMINKYGYDLKYAAHALRLLWQMEDFVRKHEVEYPYNEERCISLKEIKSGVIPMPDFINKYKQEVARIEQLIKDNPMGLKLVPDVNQINQHLVAFYREQYKIKE